MKANLCILCYCKIGGNSLQIFTTQVFERPTWDDMLITVCQSFTEFFLHFQLISHQKISLTCSLVGWQEVCRIIEIFNYLYVSGNLGNTDILYYYFFLRPSVCTSAASSTTEASTTR